MKRYLVMALVMLAACGDDDKGDPCGTDTTNAAIAGAVAGLHGSRSVACIGRGGANLATVADSDAELLEKVVELRPGAVVWSECAWTPSQHGQQSRGDYPVAGEPPQPAVAIDVGTFQCEEAAARVDVVVVDSINDIVLVETYRCSFMAEGDAWVLTECRLGSTS